MDCSGEAYGSYAGKHGLSGGRQVSGTRDNLNENSKYTVLIAEDEKITREGVEEFLKSKGFNVIAVANGEEVLDHFRDASLVLLDIMMPSLLHSE